MDRDNFSRANSQIGFISFVLLPLVESLSKLFPVLHDNLIPTIKESLVHYENMKETTELSESFVNPENSRNKIK
jgi:high affinity cGMP-specific 3',5'-cyclic phosphodiesterase 9